MTRVILTSDPGAAASRVRERARAVHPGRVLPREASLDELLASLPVLSRHDLAQRMSDQAHWLDAAVVFSETSGTTGEPLPTPRGAVDLAWNAANQATAYLRFLEPGIDRVAMLHPSILSPFIEASSIALRQLGIGQVRVFPIPRVCDYQRMFEVLDRYRITTVMSTPSLVCKMLHVFATQGDGRLPRHLTKWLLTGEPLGVQGIGNLKRIVGASSLVVPFVYGSSEAATLMIGREDGRFDPLLHDFVFELEQRAGSAGRRLIVTWLRDGLMPVLRYDTGDDFELCPGGSQALRFLGRSEPSGRHALLRAEVEEAVYGLGLPVFHYEGSFSQALGRLRLDIVVGRSGGAGGGAVGTADAGDAGIGARLQARLPAWEVSVRVNPASIGFMQFSPTPKTGRLVEC